MTKIINTTPHAIVLNNGNTFETSEHVSRVSATFIKNEDKSIDGNQVFTSIFGNITGLPHPQDNTIFIVSSIVLEAAKRLGRTDVVAPATGHPDCVRNDKGHIVSVPGFVN